MRESGERLTYLPSNSKETKIPIAEAVASFSNICQTTLGSNEYFDVNLKFGQRYGSEIYPN